MASNSSGAADANGFIGGQQADDQSRHGHQKDGQAEHLLAADLVTIVGNDDAPQRAGQIAGRKNAQRLQLAHPIGQIGREEQRANHIGEKDEHHEVVKLQRSAQSR